MKRVLLALALIISSLIEARGALTADQKKAEFFRLVDFSNAALLTRNTGLTAVKTEQAKTTPNYTSAMTGFWGAIPGKNYTAGLSRVKADSTAFAQDFFTWIDLDHAGLETVKAYVNAGDYASALEAWRDYEVTKFRGLGLPQLYQHTYKPHPRQQAIASLLLGEMSQADYLAGITARGGCDFYEIYGMSGAPGTIGPINWLAQPPTSDTSQDSLYGYGGGTFASSLVYRYYTGPVIAGATNTNLTLTGTGTQVTAMFASAHGLTTGQLINITGAKPAEYNGLFRVTVLDSKRVSYTTLTAVTATSGMNWSRQACYARESAPLQKWFEILGDFSTRQKSLVSALGMGGETTTINRTAYRTLYQGCDWGLTSGNVLGQGTRVKELLSAIAIFCKLLPEATPVWRDWATDIQKPLTTPLADDATKLISAEALARICLSLVADTPEALMLRYYKASATPNQRYNGLNALYLDACVLDEFKGSPELLTQTDAAISDFCRGMFYPDGAMIERSPNYNQGDADSMRQITTFTGTNATAGIVTLKSKLEQFDRVTAFMQSPLGGLPRMASYVQGNPPALWSGAAVVTTWRATFLKSSFVGTTEPTAAAIYKGMLDSGQPMPGVSSVAFPYAGYYLMRNGWGSRAHFLYFANTPPGNGHRQLDQNGIQVSAFGRELITIAGPPPYNETFVDASQASDYVGFAAYQGESSSFKCNSVVVDGRSQNEGNTYNPEVTSTTMANPWYASEDFDYVEGTYSAGYGGSSVYNPLLAVSDTGAAITGVTHRRSVIFLRQAGLWLVIDRLTGTGSHSYRQVWNFPARSGTDSLSGFLPSEVVADGTAQTIRTTSATGPNVTLYHMGPDPVTYETYSGSRNPYLGWFGTGIGGLRLPTANVHAVFGATSGTQMLVTAIVPSDTGTLGPIATDIEVKKTADGTGIDASFGLVNGNTVRLIQARQPQTVQLGSRKITATTVLNVTKADATQSGLVVGAAGSEPAAASGSFGAMEAFDYPAGTLLNTTGSDALHGWSTGWKSTPDLLTELDATYVTGSGSLVGEFGTPVLTSGGNLTRATATGYPIQIHRGLIQPVDLSRDASYYFSFIVKLPTDISVSSACQARLRLINAASPNTIDTYFGIGPYETLNNPTKKLIIQGSLLGTTFRTTQEAAIGKTCLIVVKLTGTSAARGAKQAWIKAFGPGDTVAEPADWGTASVSSTATAVFPALGCFCAFYTSLAVGVDEIRVGNSWNDVVIPTSFAFSATAESFAHGSRIVAPTAFSWTANGTLSAPSTGDPDAPGAAVLPDSTIVLRTRSFRREGDLQTITWASIPGTQYRVEWTDNLVDWSSGGQSEPICAIDTVTTYSDPAPGVTARFYRIRKLN